MCYDGKHSVRERNPRHWTFIKKRKKEKAEMTLDFQQGLNICRATPLEKVHFTLIKPTLPIREEDQE